jgi:hypothetical protein
VPTFARPSADVSRGSWTTHSGATTNLWATIDDETADDADFVQSALGTNNAYEVRLSSVAPAILPRAHSVILRGRKSASAGNQRGVTVALVQGTTIIGSQDFPDLPATVQQQIIDVPRAWAATITDYADLRLRFTATGATGGGSARRSAIVTGAALRVPSASDLVDDLLTRWGITVDQSNGTWQVSRSGFVGVGETLARAVMDLYERMRAADFASAELERRYEIARSLWKVVSYETMRQEIIDGVYTLPSHQTVPFALAKIDAKLTRFAEMARGADAQEAA